MALYPPGSRWLGEGDSQARSQQDSNREEGAGAGSVGARSGRLVPPAAGSSGLGYEAGARRSSSGRPAGRSASRERDRVQIDAQSLPTTLTLWGESDSIGTGRSGNRSVQSTSRVTDKAAAATATAAGTPSRRGRSARRQIQMQLQQQQQAAKLQQLKRAGPVVAARIGARLPQLKVHLTHSQSQSRPQPEHTLSLQSVSGGGGGGEGGGQDSPSFTSRSRSSKPAPPPPSLSQAAFVRPAASRPSPGASPAPMMKVHGLGFVSPLQLPQV